MLMVVPATLEDPPTIFPAPLLASGFNNSPNSDPGTRRPFREMMENARPLRGGIVSRLRGRWIMMYDPNAICFGIRPPSELIRLAQTLLIHIDFASVRVI
jgi:hypothetical protein